MWGMKLKIVPLLGAPGPRARVGALTVIVADAITQCPNVVSRWPGPHVFSSQCTQHIHFAYRSARNVVGSASRIPPCKVHVGKTTPPSCELPCWHIGPLAWLFGTFLPTSFYYLASHGIFVGTSLPPKHNRFVRRRDLKSAAAVRVDVRADGEPGSGAGLCHLVDPQPPGLECGAPADHRCEHEGACLASKVEGHCRKGPAVEDEVEPERFEVNLNWSQHRIARINQHTIHMGTK